MSYLKNSKLCPSEGISRYKSISRLNFFSPNVIAHVLECIKWPICDNNKCTNLETN